MSWRDSIATNLPPLREDDSASLRDDILAELTDHLDCAMQRELRQCDDETGARHAVLARFGNPAVVARRLWFDAVKEKIMMQRLLILSNVLFAIIAISLGVYAISAARANRQFQENLVHEVRQAVDDALTEKVILNTDATPSAVAAPGQQPDHGAAPPAVDWDERFHALTNDDWRSSFALGNQLVQLPADEGYTLLRNHWAALDVSPRQQILKAFAFTIQRQMHPHVFDVLDLAMTDQSTAVQNWAIDYLRDFAFTDFAQNYHAYAPWRQATEHLAAPQIIVESCRTWIARARSAVSAQDLAETLDVINQTHGRGLNAAPQVRAAAVAAQLPALCAQWLGDAVPQVRDDDASQSPERSIIRATLTIIDNLALDEEYLRRHILPIVKGDAAIEVRSLAIDAIADPRNTWAVQPLLEQLVACAQSNNMLERRSLTSEFAQGLGEIGDPSVIPTMIGLINADNTYDTVYGIGYFGLGRLASVAYDQSHDGPWWIEWWANNKQRFPESVRQQTIPPFTIELAVEPQSGQDPGDRHAVNNDPNQQYIVHGGETYKPNDPSAKAYKLLLVLPGGDGSDDFTPFVHSIQSKMLGDDYLVAQLIAPKWSDDPNRIVWPTQRLRDDQMQFSSEEFIAAVIDDVAAQYPVDGLNIFALGWSSSGPPVYAAAMQKNSRLTGAFIAMSVFKPEYCPPAEGAAGRPFYILHSPQDFIDMRFPEAARDTLTNAGATVLLETYEGGHGWHGESSSQIRTGVQWLEAHAKAPLP